jgi:hypothetical protein
MNTTQNSLKIINKVHLFIHSFSNLYDYCYSDTAAAVVADAASIVIAAYKYSIKIIN